MAYTLEAIIASHEILAPALSRYPRAVIVPLKASLALIPLTEDLMDEIGTGHALDRFEHFIPAIRDWIQLLSATGLVAYVEAEFFGGIGSQSATVWSGGVEVLAPVHGYDAINQALRALGTRSEPSSDEFDTVGLGRHRHTASWRDDPTRLLASSATDPSP